MIEALKKDGFSYDEIESIKRWLKDIEEWKVVDYDVVKKVSREKLFSKEKTYV